MALDLSESGADCSDKCETTEVDCGIPGPTPLVTLPPELFLEDPGVVWRCLAMRFEGGVILLLRSKESLCCDAGLDLNCAVEAITE